MFKIKDGYKLELQTPETMKISGRQNKKWGKFAKSWSGWSSSSTMQFSK